MKKKHRDIVVDGIPYTWIARSNGSVTIWKDKNIYYEDCSYGNIPVTPHTIAVAVRLHIQYPHLKDIIYIMTKKEDIVQEIELLQTEFDDLSDRLANGINRQ